MKRFIMFAALLSLMVVSESFSQFLEKTIRQIQEVPNPDSADASPVLGETVLVYGVVSSSARVNGGAHLWYTGDRIRFALKDPSDSIFNYITVVAADTNYFNGLGFDLLVEGDSIKVYGKVTEYRSLTQLEVLKEDTCYSLLGTSTANLSPVERPVSDFFNGTAVTRKFGEYYESGFVKLSNLTVISTVGAEFTVADANGNQITVDDQSNRIFSATPPPAGSQISTLQGYMFTNSASGWTINPRSTQDYSVAFAPSITNIVRLDTFPTSTSTVNIRARITTKSSTITSADLFYSVDGVFGGKLAMTSPDSVYTVTIPAANKDSAVVTYYFRAANGDGKVSYSPSDTVNDRYFYVTHNRPLMIQDVQFSPLRRGSSFVGNYVTVRGIATTSRKDFSAIYIQNGTGPWSAIRILARDSKDTAIARGDELTVRGYVREQFDLTVIDTISFVVNSTGNPLPQPSKIKPSDVRTGGPLAEAYESVLLGLDSVYVVNLNEDASSNSNFGEFGISEDSSKTSGLRVDDFSIKIPYTNDSVRTTRRPIIQLKKKDYFARVVGPLDYSFNNFKLLPRDSADFVGYKTVTSVRRTGDRLPDAFALNQNYPNPFNPSTTIAYSLKQASSVSLRVFNVIGQEVATLVNDVQSAGDYAVTLNASSLSSGVYFYKLEAGSFVSVKKMMLLK